MERFDLERLVDDVAALLVERGWMLATVESCTGGWVAKVCTDRPGSSAWFERGYVTYSNQAKRDVLGIDREIVEREGSVSEAVARGMVDGLRRVTGVQAALAVTGIAGPDGGTPGKPVGTVWFAWSCEGRSTVTGVRHFDGDRDTVRRQSVGWALQGLLKIVDGG